MTQAELLKQLDTQLDSLEQTARSLCLSKATQAEIRDHIYAIYTAAENELEGSDTKLVRNLMTGEGVRIARDTPRSCDPSTELFWSM